jgi:hypothetical protein
MCVMRRLLRGTAVYAAIILATLAVLELSLRAYDIVTGRVVFDELLKNSSRRTLRAHPYLQYTSSRNLRGLFTHLEPGLKFWTTTNSSGFRTHELYPKPPGRVRVLLLGDSFMHGSNAHDYETVQAVLEDRLRRELSPEVEVLSLGVPSYSGVRYAALARLYFDYLRPDVVIAAVDSSDYEEDLARYPDYLLDADGYPNILRDYRALEQSETPQAVDFALDRTMVVGGTGVGRELSLRAGSSLVNNMWLLKDYLAAGRETAATADPSAFAILTPEQFRSRHCGVAQTSTVPWPYCFSLPEMVTRFQPTRKSLEYVKKRADAIGARMFVSSYPYPWFVQVNRSLAHQAFNFGSRTQLDFRTHRDYPKLLAQYAGELGVTHLDAYPIFEDASVNFWGDFDPHFNAGGYRRYVDFLFDAIAGTVKERLAHQAGIMR